MSSLRLASLCLAALVPATAWAAPPVPAPSRLDPAVTRAIETGLTGVFSRGPRGPGRARVLIELVAPVTPASIATLEARGARLTRVEGRPLAWSRFVPAVVDAAAAARLAAWPGIVRISLAADRGPPPDDASAALSGMADARGARPQLGELTGAGVTIGDVDTMIDPFHPTFFRGDGGWYDWIDTDGDGVFTAIIDVIDLDGNGQAGPGETPLYLTANTVPQTARPIAFDPGLDWVYLDTNGNGKRDYGAAAGFDDTAPAFGEPLFAPDDANRDGVLDPSERFVRLKTSKVKKIFVNLDTPTVVSQVYERGVNLASTKFDWSGGTIYGSPDASHGTGVSTILVGDLPLLGRRWTGFAPDADLLLAWDAADSLPVDGTTWLLAQDPDVMLYEIAPWTGMPLDGSDPISTMIDAATDVAHTCPTGDHGSARKHAGAQIAAGMTTQLGFDLPANAIGGTMPLTYVQLSINVRGGTAQAISLVEPGGASHALLSAPSGSLSSGYWYATKETTSRSTYFVDGLLYSPSAAQPLAVGAWKINVTAPAGQAITVDAYLSDNRSGFGLGAAWDAGVASERSTIAIPSVADRCIAVNAHAAHLPGAGEFWFDFPYDSYDVPSGYFETSLGQLRAYSPRGPRIDGVMKPDITAPDNPWVATTTAFAAPYGSFRVFGGTSGSGPHVTGAAALLVQAGVRGDAVRTAIRDGAERDADVGTVPNANFGYGRLDVAGALGVTTPGEDFTISLSADPAMPQVGDAVQLVVTPQGSASALTGLELRWDEGYDGSWDGAYAALAARPFAATAAGSYRFKVRARNAGGRLAEATLRLRVYPPGQVPSDAGVIEGDAGVIEGDAGVIEADGGGGGGDEEGCGCTLGGRPYGGGGFALLFLAGLVLRPRRRDARAAAPRASRRSRPRPRTRP